MQIINKPVYKCEYCGQEFFSNKGGLVHEKHYCKKNPTRPKPNPEYTLGIAMFAAVEEITGRNID